MSIKKKRTILSYYQVGAVLDQTQPKYGKKCNNCLVVRNNIYMKLAQLDEVTQKYGVTLTLKKIFHDEDPEELHDMIKSIVSKSNIWKKINYILFPEFDSSGKLHYHGVIWDCYQLPFMKCVNWWRRKYGFVKPELSIRYYNCGADHGCIQAKKSKARFCWKHYISKDNPNGLSILFHY